MAELAERIVNVGRRDLVGYAGEVVHEASADAEYLVDNPEASTPDHRQGE